MIIAQATPTQPTPAPTPPGKQPASEPPQTHEPVDAHAGTVKTSLSPAPNLVYKNGVPQAPVAASQLPVPAQPVPAPPAGDSPCVLPKHFMAHFAIGALAGGIGAEIGALFVENPYTIQATTHFLLGLVPGGLAGLAATEVERYYYSKEMIGKKAVYTWCGRAWHEQSIRDNFRDKDLSQHKLAWTAGVITGLVFDTALMFSL